MILFKTLTNLKNSYHKMIWNPTIILIRHDFYFEVGHNESKRFVPIDKRHLRKNTEIQINTISGLIFPTNSNSLL